MNLKKMIIINVILTFLLCFLSHFMYEWWNNPIFSILFPVNESIWEHMKMLYTTILLYGIIEFIIMKIFNINNNNFLVTLLIKSVIIIPIYLVMFIPLYNLLGENMFVSISLMLISIIIVNIIGYKLLQTETLKYQNIISIILIILIYILMGILTYKPPRLEIFFDTTKEVYGINDYLIKKY